MWKRLQWSRLIKNIQPFHDHPFHLYEGERLEDMIASVKEHGILNPVIVQKIDGGYEMHSGHNRMNAAKLAGLKEVPAIVKTDLSEEEAYVSANIMLCTDQAQFHAGTQNATARVIRQLGEVEWEEHLKKLS